MASLGQDGGANPPRLRPNARPRPPGFGRRGWDKGRGYWSSHPPLHTQGYPLRPGDESDERTTVKEGKILRKDVK